MAEGSLIVYSFYKDNDYLCLVEVIKLQKHLVLLREEYVKLQNKYTELEKKYNLLSSISNQNPHFDPNESYISRLLKTISDLFDRDLYRCLKPCLFCIF